jgi:hypothetical protein
MRADMEAMFTHVGLLPGIQTTWHCATVAILPSGAEIYNNGTGGQEGRRAGGRVRVMR